MMYKGELEKGMYEGELEKQLYKGELEKGMCIYMGEQDQSTGNKYQRPRFIQVFDSRTNLRIRKFLLS